MTAFSNPFTIAPLFFFFFFLNLRLYSCFLQNDSVLCPEIEKQALLGLKQSLSDPSHRLLSSWIAETNCCSWRGVVCNSFSGGHVHQLRLRGYNLTGKLNPSLLNLTYLMYLDLSSNNFSGETIPSFFGSFTTLNYLNLSYSNFGGTIPNIIGNLSNLNTLSLEGFGELSTDNMEWLSGLYQLEHLNMNYANLSRATNWFRVINKLSSLKELHLRDCDLYFMAPMDVVNISSLSTLDLSLNYFPTFLPKWIFQLSNLVYLDISDCEFEGPIPNIINTTKIQHIDCSHNNFNLTIPNWLYSCKDLVYVDFYYNQLQGPISSDIGNLSSLSYLSLVDNDLSGTKIPSEIGHLNKMLHLDLSECQLHGEIPYSFGNMSNLQHMYLSANELVGALPISLGKMSNLQYMDLSANELVGALPISLGTLSSLKYMYLSFNKLSGNIPESIGELFNLESLYISDNMLRGVVTENHFVNLTNLKAFYASRNHLTLKVKPNWIPPFQLEKLAMRSWNLGPNPQIPTCLKTQRKMQYLDLSNIGMSGTIPDWIWKIPQLNLSNNNLNGNVPDVIGERSLLSDMHYSYISLSSNQLSGPLPRVSQTINHLDLSNNSFTGSMSHFLCGMANVSYTRLEVLLLNKNKLSGKLPDCWMNCRTLARLNLGNNNFSGSIPNSIGIPYLESLTLSGNKFSGQIPSSLLNSPSLVKVDLGNNDLEGNIPTWMGKSLPQLRILILRSNKLSGGIPLELCHLQWLQVLDLSNNNFFGIIPRCFNNLTTLVNETHFDEYFAYFRNSTNSSYGYIESVDITTKGKRWHYDSILYLVTSIDLSMNNLIGEIPKELTSLAELRFLNLSGNNLTGLIPNNIGEMKQLEALDLSRNNLYGEIPNSFTVMYSLNRLNLSYNKLIGKIPECTQLLGMDPSSFAGTSLCGPPLTTNCSRSPTQTHKELNSDHKPEIQWFYVFVSLGYAVGLSLACSLLVLKKSWRVSLFGFVEDTWDAIYVYFHIKWKRLQRRLGRNSPEART